jgi:hypothetical protein
MMPIAVREASDQIDEKGEREEEPKLRVNLPSLLGRPH